MKKPFAVFLAFSLSVAATSTASAADPDSCTLQGRNGACELNDQLLITKLAESRSWSSADCQAPGVSYVGSCIDQKLEGLVLVIWPKRRNEGINRVVANFSKGVPRYPAAQYFVNRDVLYAGTVDLVADGPVLDKGEGCRGSFPKPWDQTKSAACRTVSKSLGPATFSADTLKAVSFGMFSPSLFSGTPADKQSTDGDAMFGTLKRAN